MNDFIRLLPSLKGAAISTLFLLLLDPGRVWQQKEVALLTGYSLKSVAMGLEQLKLHALANFHGKSNGWALSDGVKQLELIHTALLGVDNSPNSVDNSGDNFPALLGESTPQHGKFTHCLPPNTENLRIASPSTYTRTHARVFSSSSFNLFKKKAFKKSFKEKKKEEEREQHGKFTHCPIRDLLLQAGVGDNSPKMREILAMNLEVDFVRGHVNYVQARYESPGVLITRLLEKRPVPGRLPDSFYSSSEYVPPPPLPPLARLWKEALPFIEARMTKATYNTFFSSSALEKEADGVYFIRFNKVPSQLPHILQMVKDVLNTVIESLDLPLPLCQAAEVSLAIPADLENIIKR